jgi:hypothetical protein
MIDFITGIVTLAVDEIKNWIHNNQGSITSYLLKFLLAMFVFVMVRDLLTTAITKVITNQTLVPITFKDLRGRNTQMAFIVMSITKYLILTFLLYEIILQLNVVEVDPLATITISSGIILILVIQGYFTKKIRRVVQLVKSLIKGREVILPDSKNIPLPDLSKSSDTGKMIRKIFSLFGKLFGLLVAIVIVFLINQGIAYVIDSKGEDITHLLRLPEYKIHAETHTVFSFGDEASTPLPFDLGGGVKVRTDGSLNIIYINNRQVGINTSDRKYKFYGVSINQAEITASRVTDYKYDDRAKINQTFLDVHSDSYIYYNVEQNDCLILTVNKTSNRVASMTYFTDFNLISELLNITY